MNTTNIIATITALIIALLASPIMPFLIAKFGTEKAKKDAAIFDGYVTKAKVGVAAAEQFIEKNEDKKAFVVSFLKSVGVPEHVTNVVTEAAVGALDIINTIFPAASQIDNAVQSAVNLPVAQPEPMPDSTPVAAPATPIV